MNNLQHCFLREIVLNDLGEKLMTEMEADPSLHQDMF